MDQNQNTEPKNLILAVLACVGFYLAYNSYLSDKYPRKPTTATQQQTESTPVGSESKNSTPSAVAETTSPAAKPEVAPTQETEKIERLSVDDLTFETKGARFEFNQDLSAFSSIKLQDYKQTKKGEEPVELLDSPFIIQGTALTQNVSASQTFSAKRDGNKITFSKKQGPWLIEQTFAVGAEESPYGIPVTVNYKNVSNSAQELVAGILAQTSVVPLESKGGFIPGMNYERKLLILGVNEERDDEDTEGYCDDYRDDQEPAFTGRAENIDYIGFDNHYFLKVFQPQQDKMDYRLEYASQKHPGDGCPISVYASQPQGQVKPGDSIAMKYRFYFGPKKTTALEAFSPKLKSSLYLGWFGIIARPLLMAVKGLYDVLGNYGLAIILVTLVLKMLFFPLTRAAQVSMKKMQKLQPQMTAIREKHKDDPRRQQQELMKFMSQNKINPAKGCLPILPQIPVFIAFYNVLSFAIELRHAPFFGWIQDLSVADPYLITPLLLGVGMFAQQKLTPHPGMDKNQARIMMMMPVVFTVMMLSLPAGMVLYMLVNTIVSIVQQQWLNKRLA